MRSSSRFVSCNGCSAKNNGERDFPGSSRVRSSKKSRQTDDESVVEEIRWVGGDSPSYGHRHRVWGTLRNERVGAGLVPFNASASTASC